MEPQRRPGFVAIAALALFAACTAGLGLGWWDATDEAVREPLVIASEPLWLQLAALPGDEPVVIAVTGIAAAWLWWLGRRDDALSVALAVLLTGAIVFGAKLVLARDRPIGADSSSGSFPSGHTAMATIGAAVVYAWVVPAARRAWHRLAFVAAAGLPVVVALARLALGEHWPSDVIASILVAAFALSATAWSRRTWSATPSRRDRPSRQRPDTRPR